MIENYAG